MYNHNNYSLLILIIQEAEDASTSNTLSTMAVDTESQAAPSTVTPAIINHITDIKGIHYIATVLLLRLKFLSVCNTILPLYRM